MIGVVVRESNVAQALEQIIEAESLGVPAVWLTTARAGRDGLTLLAAVAARTSQVKLGTSIMPTWPRHPVALAQQALVVDGLAPGRLRLGIGPAARDGMEQLVGATWRAPLQHLREYITILRALFQTGSVDFQGSHFRAWAQIPSPVEVPVFASALRPGAYELCGEVADGAISWMCPPSYLQAAAIPALQRGAEKGKRPVPKLVVHIPVCISQDLDAVRQAAREQVGLYTRLASYAAMFAEAGYEVSEGLTDSLIDDLVIFGDETAVAEGLQRLRVQGADEVIVHPLLTQDRDSSLRSAWRSVAIANG